jgi:hypothetical protein
MAFNLLDAVRSYVTPDLVDRLSNQLGESSSGVSRAITAAIPVLLAGFINRAEKGDADGLLRDAHVAADSNVLNNPQRLAETGMGNFLSGGLDRLQGMYGSRSDSIISSITQFSGIKSSSVQGLLGLLAQMGLSVLGRHARENTLSASGLSSYLSSQKSVVVSAMPEGLSAGSFFEGDRLAVQREREREFIGTVVAKRKESTTDRIKSERTADVEDRTTERRGSSWIWWLLLALGAMALLWYLTRNGCN